MLDEKTAYRVAEIERRVREFKEKFESKTANPEDFITISEIEGLWSDLQNSTNNIYSDMLMDMMGSVDESGLIRKKKESTGKKG